MADEAFALSPISARAAQPSEEDYAAIHTAFMETSRGRWFLGEYAKRNRNADTRLVLDAVARIEQGLAAQKEAVVEADLSEALAAIRKAVTEAQAAANSGLDGLAFDERLAPIAKGVRIIREISWRWRETGADGRICDILDSQVAAIESSTSQLSLGEARAAMDQAFAAIEARIDEYSGDAPPAEARREADAVDANVVPFPAQEVAEAEVETAAVGHVAEEAIAEAPVAEVAHTLAADIEEPVTAAVAESLAENDAPIAAVVGAIEIVDEAAADAHDEAVLDLIAAEMSVPQPIEDDIAIAEIDVAEIDIAEPVVHEPVIAAAEMVEVQSAEPEFEAPALVVTEAIAPSVAPMTPSAEAIQSVTTAAHAATQVGEAEPESEISIGAAVIASGILKKPNVPANDPLAPIRRMSQAEKIAFFS